MVDGLPVIDVSPLLSGSEEGHVTRHGAISRGDQVLARLPNAARRLAADRRYLPPNVPVVSTQRPSLVTSFEMSRASS